MKHQCVFCGRGPTTLEHVFPQWLLEVIPGEGRITHTSDAPERSDAESRTWVADAVTFKARVVCQAECNGGWMSRLEQRVRPFIEPMIRGQYAALYEQGAAVVAHWALKTAVMIDFAQEPEDRCVSAEVYPQLYAAQRALPGTFAWVGACRFGAGALGRPRAVDLGGSDSAGFGFTLCVGHLVIEILWIPVQDGTVPQIGGDLGPALRRMWPYTNLVVTPAFVLERPQVARLGELLAISPISWTARA